MKPENVIGFLFFGGLALGVPTALLFVPSARWLGVISFALFALVIIVFLVSTCYEEIRHKTDPKSIHDNQVEAVGSVLDWALLSSLYEDRRIKRMSLCLR